MLFEFIFNFLCSVISSSLSLIGGFVALPFNLIQTLADFTCYGSFILGGDLIILFVGSVLFWSTAKISLGTVLFLYRLIPFN